jgi:hypothetical protein
VLQTCYDVAITHSEVWRLNSWQRLCACLVVGVLAVNIVVVQELETSNKLPCLVFVIYIFFFFFSRFLITKLLFTLNSHFSRKEVFAAFRRYFFKSTFTHSYVCGMLLIEMLNNHPPSVVTGTCLEAEAKVSRIHDF